MARRRVVDVGIAVLAFAFTLGLLFGPEESTGNEDPDGIAVLLTALSTLPLAARRWNPVAILVFVTLASSLMFALGYPSGPPVGPGLALFFVGSSGARVAGSFPLTLALIWGLFAIHVAGAGIGDGELPGAALLFGIPFWFAAWVFGDRMRLRRERLAELEERARRAERDAERDRELAVAEERTRIARDLHDSAGHAINVILVHAGAARLLSEKDPQRSVRALETIETVARETLGEIDRFVHALRGEERAALEPPAGLAGLDSLVQRHRDAGLGVALSVTGSHRQLGPAVDQAAYRILQESLTNALRHGTGDADVALDYGHDVFEIRVQNASARDATNAGHGVVGMRERASLIGGTLEAQRDDGVFRVRARLPYGSVEPE